jgi:glycosyltransferase involved in cell wall biosynthesis
MGGGTLAGQNVAAVRVQLIDPSADVLPYDHALAAALARRGLGVELVTSRFVHGPAPEAGGYDVSESFYRLATGAGAERPRLRRALKLVEHVPDTLRVRRGATRADLQHWQWLWLEAVSGRLLPRERPQVLTMHNVIRRGRSGRRLADRMDATIVHTRHGAELLGGGPRVHVIPHGAFEHLTRQPDERPLPPDLAAVQGPVVLVFGVVRPYKGVEVAIDAFRALPGAELWVVGRPLGVDLEALRPPANVRLVPRYVSDPELPAFFRRADVLVLPHRNVDVSGVLFAGLAFGKPMVLSDVGGFREVVEEHGAGRLVPPGDPVALGEAVGSLLADPGEGKRLAESARAAAAGPYSWDAIAARTQAVYEEVRAG